MVLRARYQEQVLERAAAPEWEDNDLVFCHPSHGPRGTPPTSPTNASSRLPNSPTPPPEPAPLDSPPTLRVTGLASGEPPKVVQERLGHHSTAFTQDTYQHLLPGMGAAAARRFEDLILDDLADTSERPDERP